MAKTAFLRTTPAPQPAASVPVHARNSSKQILRLPLSVMISAAVLASSAFTASAQSRSVPIVRDAEIEALVSDYTTPILNAAGLGKQRIKTILVNSQSFNAFVDGRRIFINTGALLQSETPN